MRGGRARLRQTTCGATRRSAASPTSCARIWRLSHEPEPGCLHSRPPAQCRQGAGRGFHNRVLVRFTGECLPQALIPTTSPGSRSRWMVKWCSTDPRPAGSFCACSPTRMAFPCRPPLHPGAGSGGIRATRTADASCPRPRCAGAGDDRIAGGLTRRLRVIDSMWKQLANRRRAGENIQRGGVMTLTSRLSPEE